MNVLEIKKKRFYYYVFKLLHALCHILHGRFSAKLAKVLPKDKQSLIYILNTVYQTSDGQVP